MTTDNHVYAVDTATMQANWGTEQAGFTSAPTVGDGVIFLAGTSGITTLDAATGQKQWRQDGAVQGNLALAGGRLYAGNNEGLRARDAHSSDICWKFDEVSSEVVAVVDGAVIMANPKTREIYAVGGSAIPLPAPSRPNPPSRLRSSPVTHHRPPNPRWRPRTSNTSSRWPSRRSRA